MFSCTRMYYFVVVLYINSKSYLSSRPSISSRISYIMTFVQTGIFPAGIVRYQSRFPKRQLHTKSPQLKQDRSIPQQPRLPTQAATQKPPSLSPPLQSPHHPPA